MEKKGTRREKTRILCPMKDIKERHPQDKDPHTCLFLVSLSATEFTYLEIQ